LMELLGGHLAACHRAEATDVTLAEAP
jgi:hypothetical protein